MSVAKGYKQTDVGIIPEDWNVKKLREVSHVVRGGSPRPAGDPKYFNGKFIPWLTVASLTNVSDSELYVSTTESHLTEAGSKHSRTLEEGTLIIANSGATLGVAKLLSMKCCANDGIAVLSELKKNIDSRYIVYFINTKTKILREVIATGNGQPNLNTELIGNIQIPFPPTKEEQTVIANALMETDDFIASLEKLIAKKQNIKQATMQVLLTEKRKLKGFSGKWQTRRLGEVAEINKGQLITAKTVEDGTIPVIAGGKQPAYYHSIPNRFGKTITVSGSGASAGYVSFHNYPIFASDCSTIQESKNYSIEFLYFFLQLIQGKIYKMQTGGAQPHIHPSDLFPIQISIPEKEEQTAIANILSDMDAEIEQLQEQLSKYKSAKQGMMQNLLTGKTRLV